MNQSQTKDSFWMKLIKNNTGVSSKNFLLVCATLGGIVLLCVLISGMIVDIVHHNTISIDMGDAATFICAVATLFGAAGLTKAGSEWSENKFLYNTSHKIKNGNPNSQMCEGDDEDIPIPDEEEVTDEDEEIKEEDKTKE